MKSNVYYRRLALNRNVSSTFDQFLKDKLTKKEDKDERSKK
jgi:hypothetical protein